MVLALVRKELRELRAFAIAALVLYFIYVCNLTGKGSPVLASLMDFAPWTETTPPEIPFVQGEFQSILFFIGAALALALGFRQSAWEPSQGTALYLLHLPLSRRAILSTKLATGIGLLLLCTLMPILAYAAWAATPGTHPGPFEWTMTGPAFQVWLILPLLYLGAFASGLRPARWFGSRLLPVFSVLIPAVLAITVPPWWLIGFPVLCITAVVLMTDILWIAGTRDF
jgi:ABC-type transport system involved in multi-copper enzyme maturation permease subunit